MEQKPEPENKPLSWDEIKDKVVQEYNYDNWQHFENECPGYLTMQSFMDAAAKLFARESFHRGAREQREICSGDPNDFERDLYDLVKRHINAGLKRPDLIHKLEYVTQSCRVS